MANTKIDPSKTAVENLLAMVDSLNPTGPTLPSQITVGVPQVAADPNNTSNNTSVEITAVAGQGFKNNQTVFYERITLDAEVATPATAVDVPNSATPTDILASVATHYGFVLSEISWFANPEAPGDTFPVNSVETIQCSGSLLYQDGTGSVELNWLGPAFQDAVVADAPYAYWPLRDATGTVATDLSGNARHGTYQAGVTLADATMIAGTQKYPRLSGAANSFVEVDAGAAFCAGAAWSAECWMDASSVSQENLDNSATGVTFLNNIASASPTNIPADGFVWSTFGTSFIVWQSASNGAANPQSATGTTPAINTLSHVAVTFDSGTLTMYLNGESIKTATAVPDAVAKAILQIGVQSWTGGAFVGHIGEVAVYDKALTAEQVLNHFNAGSVA